MDHTVKVDEKTLKTFLESLTIFERAVKDGGEKAKQATENLKSAAAALDPLGTNRLLTLYLDQVAANKQKNATISELKAKLGERENDPSGV